MTSSDLQVCNATYESWHKCQGTIAEAITLAEKAAELERIKQARLDSIVDDWKQHPESSRQAILRMLTEMGHALQRPKTDDGVDDGRAMLLLVKVMQNL